VDSTRGRRTTPGGFPHEVPTPNIQDSLAGPHQELRGAARTGLGPVSDLIKRRRNSVFGQIARLSEDMPAHQALRCHVDLTRPSSRAQLEASPRSSEQPMDRPAPQGQQ